MAKSDLRKWSEILVLIGAIIALIEGILTILGIGFFSFWSIGPYISHLLTGIFNLVFGIIIIIFALITLATSGVIKFPLAFEKNWIMLLILSIILIVFGANLGGGIALIGAILLLIEDLM